MAERSLETRYRSLVASFTACAEGARMADSLGPGFRPALDLIAFALVHDTALPPRELDREHLRAFLTEILPGRLAGDEPYRHELPDLLESFLMHVALEEGLATAWEWSSEIGARRDVFDAALRDPGRARMGGTGPKRTPDVRAAPKLGRNDPCFCGSGKKYKHCCFRLFP